MDSFSQSNVFFRISEKLWPLLIQEQQMVRMGFYLPYMLKDSFQPKWNEFETAFDKWSQRKDITLPAQMPTTKDLKKFILSFKQVLES